MAGQMIRDAIKGYPLLLGANKVPGGYQFAVEVPGGADASLVLYHKDSKTPLTEIPFGPEHRTGNVCAFILPGFSPCDYEYNFKINDEIVLDPWAYSISGRKEFGVPVDGELHEIRCGFLPERAYNWGEDRSPDVPFEEMLLYKIHVRGYTMQRKLSPKKRGTFAGLVQMIPYWQELGINALELMPAWEFMEVALPGPKNGLIHERRTQGKVNYWGYLSGCYFAPKSSYCAGGEPEKEFRDMIKALHRAGIVCIMEMFFPADVSPMLALRALQFWKLYYHVDGFHLTGDGVPLDLILRDAVLSDVYLMADGFPIDRIYGGKAPEQRKLAQYNDGFFRDMRCFLKSDEDMVRSASWHIRDNSRFYGVINYMACQNGFTLYDMVTYNYRHNEANGEENQDGNSYNFSWNCGVEGPTRKAAIRRLREQQLRNSFLMLLLSQGVPMIYGGDEFGNSQEGNNNAYCQDNPVGWTDWKGITRNKRLLRFVKDAIAFRKEHPVLHQREELRSADYKGTGFPDISFHGERAWYLNQENASRLLGVMYNGAYGKKEDGYADDFIYVAYNFHWEPRSVALPNLPGGIVWRKAADTSDWEGDSCFRLSEETYEKFVEIGPRAILVLLGRQERDLCIHGSTLKQSQDTN